MNLTQIDKAIDRRPLAAGDIELFSEGVPKRRWIEPPFDNAGEAVRVWQAEPIHCGLVEEIVVRGEHPRTRKRSVAQHKLAIEGFIKANDGMVAIREGAVRAFGPKKCLNLLDDRFDSLESCGGITQRTAH